MENNTLDYDKMTEQLNEALAACEADECPIAFSSRSDESGFFPSDMKVGEDTWELVVRSSRFVPAHYMNDGKYLRVKKDEVTNEETQPAGI